MIVSGKYVGLIEFNFRVDLSAAGTATPEDFKKNLANMNDEILAELTPLMVENTKDIQSTLTVTQQYLDVHEAEEP